MAVIPGAGRIHSDYPRWCCMIGLNGVDASLAGRHRGDRERWRVEPYVPVRRDARCPGEIVNIQMHRGGGIVGKVSSDSARCDVAGDECPAVGALEIVPTRARERAA